MDIGAESALRFNPARCCMPVIGERVSVSIEKILLATDFSSASEKAALYAKALAHRFSSIVELAHVFDPCEVTTYEEALIGLPVNERRRISNENLERLRDDFSSSGIETWTVSSEGHRPATELLRIAKEQDVDLIVTGTQSKSGVERLILGSTAEQIIRNAGCTVLTVGPKAKAVEDTPLIFRNIVYATDFTSSAKKAAIYALSFAEDSGAHLYLCHVIGPQEPTAAGQELSEGAFQRALKEMIPEIAYDWCDPECVVEHGYAGEAILKLGGRVQADLIVLGARKASFLLTHIERGLTPELLAQATCPVMTVC
jgi:nucleotide-binding universal stress UspA family protein